MANDYNGVETGGSQNLQKINTSWFGEAWKLFSENWALWVPAVAITFYGPGLIDGYLWFLTNVTHKFGASVEHPGALVIGVMLFNLVFVTFMLNGLGYVAVRQVAGAQTTFADIFSGSRNFASTLLWIVLVGSVVLIASSLVIYPGVLVASFLLPSFALVSTGENAIQSIRRSIDASKSDPVGGKVVAFSVGLLLLLGFATMGLFLFITLPIALLVSALAYRDLIGLPGLAAGPGYRPSHVDDNKPDVVLDDSVSAGGPRVTLTGESLDEPGNLV
jgi:uncharacterized membrane protein